VCDIGKKGPRGGLTLDGWPHGEAKTKKGKKILKLQFTKGPGVCNANMVSEEPQMIHYVGENFEKPGSACCFTEVGKKTAFFTSGTVF